MRDLSVAYQGERPNVEVSDLTALVIRALGMLMGKMVKDERAEADNAAVSSNAAVYSVNRFIATDTITAAAQVLIEAQELDYDVTHVTTRRVGHVLKKMRLQHGRIGKSSKRGWIVSLNDLIRWAGSYGIDPNEITGIETRPLYKNVGIGTNGGNVGHPTPFPWSGAL